MIHPRARRRLSALLDGELAAGEESGVRAHLDRCRRCRRALGELEAAEALLRRLPAALVPLDPSPDAAGRLLSLARWAGPPRRAWGRPALGVLAAAAALAAIALVHPGAFPAATSAPAVRAAPAPRASHPSSRGVEVAARMPASFLVPSLETAGGVAYTWRQ